MVDTTPCSLDFSDMMMTCSVLSVIGCLHRHHHSHCYLTMSCHASDQMYTHIYRSRYIYIYIYISKLYNHSYINIFFFALLILFNSTSLSKLHTHTYTHTNQSHSLTHSRCSNRHADNNHCPYPLHLRTHCLLPPLHDQSQDVVPRVPHHHQGHSVLRTHDALLHTPSPIVFLQIRGEAPREIHSQYPIRRRLMSQTETECLCSKDGI